ncbi:MAG: putative metal-binding motif-containing protein [Proteobacteria bacterium]|nr:putative metal-binding motif-containing protein [Pseudomonadota bacterium]
MKKKYIVYPLVGLLLSYFAVPAMAIPTTINYQGKLLENGQPVSADETSPLPMTFRLYDTSSPGAGNLVYEELQDVTVLEGIYSIELGAEGASTGNGQYQFLDAAVSSEPELWLEVEINGEILLPRQKFTSVPFAIKAGEAAVASTVLSNSISTTEIADYSISPEKLADNAVTTSKVADGSITAEKFADFCLEGDILVKTASGWSCGKPVVQICHQGDFLHCYTGDPATLDVAACTSGFRFCDESGTEYGACVNQHTPEQEVCDQLDNDCNGIIDDNVPDSPLWYADTDNDGHGDPAVSLQNCNAVAGYVDNSDDCNDGSWAINPDLGERCDGKDSNCDGLVDNNCVTSLCTETDINNVMACAALCDLDEAICIGGCILQQTQDECQAAGITLGQCLVNNGCGTPLNPDFDCIRSDCQVEWENVFGSVPPQCASGDTRVCGSSEGLCEQGIETCGENGLWSGICVGETAPAPEICDGQDNNCDGVIDNPTEPRWCEDADGDLYTSACTEECQQPDPTWIPVADSLGEDCDDSNDQVHVGAIEICDGLDNDCNGIVDEGFPDNDQDGEMDCVDPDDDNDGWLDEEDCRPFDLAINPDAEERCDGQDNDCSGSIDDNLPLITSSLPGVCSGALKICEGVNGWVDDFASIPQYEPTEISCDGLDNDCDGMTDENLDLAGPLTENQTGVCYGARMSCLDGQWTSVYYPLIDDYASEIEANENCGDTLDNDCDGLTDEADDGCN